MSQILSASLAIAMAAGLAAQAGAAVVFSEDFGGYADTAAVQAAWTTTVNGLSLTTAFDPTPTQLATQSTGNMGRFSASQFAYRSLSQTIQANQDWTISIDMLIEGYSRSGGFGLFDATGTNGYTVRWNTTNVNQNSGRGSVQILEHGTAPVANGNDFGTALSGSRPTYAVDANNVPTGAPTGSTVGTSANGLAPVTGYRRLSGNDAATPTDQNTVTFDSNWQGIHTWTLQYTAATGRLVLTNDSPDNPNPTTVPVFDVTDTTPLANAFNRFYLIGQNTDYDNIVVDVVVPEPGTLGLLGIGLLTTLRRRAS